MEELAENITHEEVLELIQDFPLTPMRSKIIITVNVDEDEDELDLGGYGFSATQYVLAVGSQNNVINAGDRVLLNLESMTEEISGPEGSSFSIKVKPIKVGDRIFALVTDGVVDAIDNREI
tara:strand:- start:9118 stop:9480 length:363 start_codon:yes stop_codon:yes gene_type:complete